MVPKMMVVLADLMVLRTVSEDGADDAATAATPTTNHIASSCSDEEAQHVMKRLNM